MNETPTLYMLIGIPGSGKSTWINEFVIVNGFKQDSYMVLSTDNYIEAVAKFSNSTYSECFPNYIKEAEEEMWIDLNSAIANNKNIIWDQTNTTVKGRKKRLSHPGLSRYNKIAVYFNTPYEECIERIKQRPGKEIPNYVMESMKNNLVPPSIDEGFTSIVYI